MKLSIIIPAFNEKATILKVLAIVRKQPVLGLEKELERVSEKKVRAGKGKSRGRKYKKKNGPLIVVSKKDKLSRAAVNILGIDVVDVKSLNAELLAPGAKAGRLTLWTKGAIHILEKDNLFNKK